LRAKGQAISAKFGGGRRRVQNAVFERRSSPNVARGGGKRHSTASHFLAAKKKEKGRAGLGRSPSSGQGDQKISAKTSPAFARRAGLQEPSTSRLSCLNACGAAIRSPLFFGGNCKAWGRLGQEIREAQFFATWGQADSFLSLDSHGVARHTLDFSWCRQACFYYAKNLVAWTLGDRDLTYYGGTISRMNRASRLEHHRPNSSSHHQGKRRLGGRDGVFKHQRADRLKQTRAVFRRGDRHMSLLLRRAEFRLLPAERGGPHQRRCRGAGGRDTW